MRLIDSGTASVFGYIAQRWRWWHVPVVLTAMFLAACGLVWLFQSSELEKRYAEMRAAGYPVTLAELNDYYALPADVEDNTELWLRAMRLSETTSSSVALENLPVVGYVSDIPPVGQPWAEHDFVVTYLDDLREVLTAIHEAADAGGGVRLPQDFEQGPLILLPNVQQIRRLARLLSLEMHLRAHDGDIAGAADSLRATFTVGKTLERDPVLVSFLVRVAVDGIAVADTTQLLNTVDLATADLQAIQEDLRRIEYVTDLHHAMVGEQTMGLMYYDDVTTLGFSPVAARFLRIAAPAAKVKRFDLMRDAVAATNVPWHEAFSSIRLAVRWKPNKMSLTDYLVEQALPAFEACFVAGGRATARVRSLDAAIAAELFRRDQGDWPAVLNDLVPQYLPAVPIDPFDGKPLRYIVENTGFVIYSVGDDLVDDQGMLDSVPNRDYPDFGVRVGQAK